MGPVSKGVVERVTEWFAMRMTEAVSHKQQMGGSEGYL
jgi:hypothetical protein